MYRLMLIDDDDIIRTKLIKSYDWEDMGFEPPYTARDGKEALNRMPEIHPDVVVSDIRMPVMDGLELIRNLKNQVSQYTYRSAEQLRGIRICPTGH